MGEYGAMTSKVWVAEGQIKRRMFDPSKALEPMSLKFLDMPFIFK